ncbi:MAG: UDP-N-acetylmuramate dehydrogenase [Clostridia bacterium]|nr:UDP-N-acetylmuramate dehydrogenase [Clostridia bacterium]
MTELVRVAKSLNIELLENENMSRHTSFKIGGAADIYLCPQSADELKTVLSVAKAENIPLTIIGNGSNLLVSDDGINGAVISTIKCNKIKMLDENTIYADAGASLTAVCLAAKDAGLTGLEFAYGIPGSIGGALFMNAGAYGGEMKDITESAESITLDGELISRKAEDMNLGYRHSIYRENGEIITSVTLRLKKGDKKEILDRMNELMKKRKTSQPLNYPSAGSTFKRPVGGFAAALIDECGLRGAYVGGAEVSQKHAGFIINKGNATASDVLALIEKIKETVFSKKNIMLEPEVIFIGR